MVCDGRRSFQMVLKTYAYIWHECELTEKKMFHLILLVAYDLKYRIPDDCLYNITMKYEPDQETYFIGSTANSRSDDSLTGEDVIN
jgi:hypothetical protein